MSPGRWDHQGRSGPGCFLRGTKYHHHVNNTCQKRLMLERGMDLSLLGNELVGPWDAGARCPCWVSTLHPVDMPCTLKTFNKDSLNHDG